MKNAKKIIIGVVVVALVAGGGCGWSSLSKK